MINNSITLEDTKLGRLRRQNQRELLASARSMTAEKRNQLIEELKKMDETTENSDNHDETLIVTHTDAN